MRKRTTATDRNRARDAINAYTSDLLKSYKTQRTLPFRRGYRSIFHVFVDEASGAAGTGATGWATRSF
jgi:hypothetical protein